VAGKLVRPISASPIGWRERIKVHTYPEREVSDRRWQVEGGETSTCCSMVDRERRDGETADLLWPSSYPSQTGSISCNW
jgi:hypothetical protein